MYNTDNTLHVDLKRFYCHSFTIIHFLFLFNNRNVCQICPLNLLHCLYEHYRAIQNTKILF